MDSQDWLGQRLVRRGALRPRHLAKALNAQRGQAEPERLGALLVRLGFVDVVAVKEELAAQAARRDPPGPCRTDQALSDLDRTITSTMRSLEALASMSGAK